MDAVTLRSAEAYVARPYVPVRADCMHLAVLVQRELFGRRVGWVRRRNPGDAAQQAALIQQYATQLADRLEAPETGAAAIFIEDGTQYHVGTVFMRRSEVWVLHTHAGIGHSVLWRLDDCRRMGLRLEGFYRWREVSNEQ